MFDRVEAERLANALYPEKELQERTLGGAYFMARYGGLLSTLYEHVRTDCFDHQIVRL